jgi:DNA-binding transcriptional MerR regulator
MAIIAEITSANREARIPLLGRFVDNLYQGWFRDHASVADYLDFYIDGFSLEEIQEMLTEYQALDSDAVSDEDVEDFLQRLHADYRAPASAIRARELWSAIGERLEELAAGVQPKHFD